MMQAYARAAAGGAAGSGAVPAPAQPAGSSTRWRLYVEENNGGSATTLAELKFFDAADDQIATTGGEASASSIYPQGSTFNADKAFDSNLSTRWSTDTGGAQAPSWLAYEFQSSVSVAKIAIVAGNNASADDQAPRDFNIQYHDGDDWVTAQSIFDQGGWSQNEEREFVIV